MFCVRLGFGRKGRTDRELQDPRGVSACLCLKGQDGFPEKRHPKEAMKVEKAFQARGMAWGKAGRPERA